MSEMKHTPGPWTNNDGDITGIEDNGSGRGPVDVCSVYLRTVHGRHEANARLIASAPELLQALQITRGNIASLGPAGALTPYTSYQEWLAMVDAAIAKATGGQP